MSDKSKTTTHFGYQEVPVAEKASRVGAVFDSVASRYDLMNDLMSLGIHRLWKRFAIHTAGVRPGERVLDLAGGTGDLATALWQDAKPQGEVVLADINAAMLQVGRDRLTDRGIVNGIHYVQADAQCLPFPDSYFDCITIAYGLRNVTHIDQALASMFRVLRPGGRLLILEFSRPMAPLRPAYDLYSFSILPRLGQWVVGDAESYRYLAESIRMHPDQDTLKAMMGAAGFERCEYFNLTGGITALHRGYRL